ncbi:hypothetical protein [Fodinicola acaciae]|uniref:hypothetical protein n=1 Tax=Fodinicola acaciae TaxID=2681555 RepID=UPI0013D428E2|nr:hypothetical protein [Fodinicola acaciae]
MIPPFRMLDPGLALAERILAGDVRDVPAADALRRMAAALPDEDAAAVHLNFSLEILGVRPRLRRDGEAWQLALGELSDVADAATMLAVLVARAGWHRIRCCGRCRQPFIDRTMGATTRSCPAHRRSNLRG